MKNILLVCLASLCMISCDRTQCKNGLDLLPMYGKEKKCKKLIDIDNRFLADCDSLYSSRKDASEDMLRFAWKHYTNGELDKAMIRFNQAWLLDSLNADVYFGFGEVLIDRGKFEESIQYLNKSIELDSEKSNTYKSLGFAYSRLFDQTTDKKYMEESITLLKKSIAINPSDPNAYTLLTNIYATSEQQDSAKKYLEITDKLNPNLIKPEIRESILK